MTCGGWPRTSARAKKIIIFCDDDETLGFRESLDVLVVIPLEPKIAHVTSAPENVAGTPRQAETKGSGRAGPSRDRPEKAPLPLCCEGQAGADVLNRQFREVGKNLGVCHSGCEIFQHIGHRDP